MTPQQFKQKRKELNLTQEQLANELGLSPKNGSRQIRGIESGERKPSNLLLRCFELLFEKDKKEEQKQIESEIKSQFHQINRSDVDDYLSVVFPSDLFSYEMPFHYFKVVLRKTCPKKGKWFFPSKVLLCEYYDDWSLQLVFDAMDKRIEEIKNKDENYFT